MYMTSHVPSMTWVWKIQTSLIGKISIRTILSTVYSNAVAFYSLRTYVLNRYLMKSTFAENCICNSTLVVSVVLRHISHPFSSNLPGDAIRGQTYVQHCHNWNKRTTSVVKIFKLLNQKAFHLEYTPTVVLQNLKSESITLSLSIYIEALKIYLQDGRSHSCRVILEWNSSFHTLTFHYFSHKYCRVMSGSLAVETIAFFALDQGWFSDRISKSLLETELDLYCWATRTSQLNPSKGTCTSLKLA